VLWVGLVLGWLVMLLQMWSAFATVPSADRLAESRMMQIPTLQTLAALAVRSAVELGVVLVLLLPGWRSHYRLRLLGTALLLAVWFIGTTPLTLSVMHWVHRRWLAAMTLALFLSLLVAAVAGLLRRRALPA
jgi:hypothetical protein